MAKSPFVSQKNANFVAVQHVEPLKIKRMDFLNLAKERFSARAFSAQTVEEDKVNYLLECTLGLQQATVAFRGGANGGCSAEGATVL